MADLGHEMTNEILNGLEDKIAREYAVAARDMGKKLRDYMEQFEDGKAQQKALLDAGKITKKEYKDWCYRHTMMGQQWRDMKDVLTEDLKHARETALAISRGEMPDVYALNANYATYQIEHDFNLDTSFSLYNHDTAEYLLKDQRQLMPAPSTKKAAQIAADKAMQWDAQHIQSAVLQGVLQGESPYKVAARLRSVAQMDYNASVRYARTMTTSAQNAGRYEAYRRAKGLGVDLTIEWQATLDGRTRHEHRMMHGQRRDVDEPFEIEGVKILWPAQANYDGTNLPQELIWNCRCTLLSWVKGFEGDTVKESPKMGEMDFDEWQHAKEPKPKAEPEAKPEAKQEQKTLKSVDTHEGLATYLEEKYNISCSDDFDELDLEDVKTQVESMEKMFERYPFLSEEVEKLTIGKAGVISYGGGELTFSRKYFAPGGESLSEAHKRYFNTKWWSAKGEGASVQHELGHAIESWIGKQAYTGVEQILAWNEGWEAKEIVKQALANIKKTPFGKGKKVQELLDDMSRYGGSDRTRAEALAEAFANFFDPETETHPLAAEIVRLTEERIKQFGGLIK